MDGERGVEGGGRLKGMMEIIVPVSWCCSASVLAFWRRLFNLVTCETSFF